MSACLCADIFIPSPKTIKSPDRDTSVMRIFVYTKQADGLRYEKTTEFHPFDDNADDAKPVTKRHTGQAAIGAVTVCGRGRSGATSRTRRSATVSYLDGVDPRVEAETVNQDRFADQQHFIEIKTPADLDKQEAGEGDCFYYDSGNQTKAVGRLIAKATKLGLTIIDATIDELPEPQRNHQTIHDAALLNRTKQPDRPTDNYKATGKDVYVTLDELPRLGVKFDLDPAKMRGNETKVYVPLPNRHEIKGFGLPRPARPEGQSHPSLIREQMLNHLAHLERWGNFPRPMLIKGTFRWKMSAVKAWVHNQLESANGNLCKPNQTKVQPKRRRGRPRKGTGPDYDGTSATCGVMQVPDAGRGDRRILAPVEQIKPLTKLVAR
jgi:hypothetical protein